MESAKNRQKEIDKDNKKVEEKVGSQSNCLFNRHTTNIATSDDAATKIISSAIIMTLMYGLYHGQQTDQLYFHIHLIYKNTQSINSVRYLAR